MGRHTHGSRGFKFRGLQTVLPNEFLFGPFELELVLDKMSSFLKKFPELSRFAAALPAPMPPMLMVTPP